jgi:hypothetical protein
MSYIINNSRGQIVAVVDDGTVNTTATDLALIGRSVTNYGEYQNENYVYLLENFANDSAPLQPILGQLWYNSATDTINTYSTENTWNALASQTYVDAQKISPAFTGVPTAPTASGLTNTTQLATTAFVQNNKISPAFTGVPTAPTAISDTNTTQLATTAFVQNQLGSASGFSSAGIIGAAGFSTTGLVSAVGNVLGGNLATSGNIVALGLISAAGNVTGGNVNSVGQIVANAITASGNITGGNVLGGANVNAVIHTGTTVSVTGNITGGNVLGGANVNAVTHTGTTVSVTGNITGGNINTAGQVSAAGNITGANFVTAGTVTANNIVANNITTSGSNAFRLPNLTDVEIAALTPLNGDLVYNTTTGYAQLYQQGVWLEITIARYS